MKDAEQRIVEALGRAWSESHGIEEDASARGRFILREGLHEDVTVSVSASDLLELIREARKCNSLQDEARASADNTRDLLLLLYEAQQIMKETGTTDENLRKAGRFLGLLNPHRTQRDWEAIADQYWRLRFGTPPDTIGGPVEPLSQQDAERIITDEHNLKSFNAAIKAWQRLGIKVKTGKRHPAYNDGSPKK